MEKNTENSSIVIYELSDLNSFSDFHTWKDEAHSALSIFNKDSFAAMQ